MTDDLRANDPHVTPVLDRYLAGEASADERARVAAWQAGRPDRAGLLGALGAVLPGEHRSTVHVDVDGAVRRLVAIRTTSRREASRRHGDRTLHVGHPAALRRAGWMVRWVAGPMAIAASVVLATVLVRSRDVGSAGVLPPARSYSTATGQTAVMTLADGSRVTLAPRTTLRLAPGFGRTARTVELSGEAYFDVRRSTGTPFVVRVGTVTTRVLGTAFDVRRYRGDAAAHIAVVTGKVAVATSDTGRGSAVTLVAGAVAVATDSSVATTPAGGTAPYTAWVDGVLVFHEAPAVEVLAALTRWYGYEFRLADSAIALQKLTVGVSTTSSREALATIKLALGVELRFDGTVVTLSPRPDARPASAAPRPRGERDPMFSPGTREVGR